MSVTVTMQSSAFASEAPPKTIRHSKAQATLVDGRGQLLVLDTREVSLTTEVDSAGRPLYGTAESELVRHVIATYADGVWSHAKVGA